MTPFISIPFNFSQFSMVSFIICYFSTTHIVLCLYSFPIWMWVPCPTSENRMELISNIQYTQTRLDGKSVSLYLLISSTSSFCIFEGCFIQMTQNVVGIWHIPLLGRSTPSRRRARKQNKVIRLTWFCFQSFSSELLRCASILFVHLFNRRMSSITSKIKGKSPEWASKLNKSSCQQLISSHIFNCCLLFPPNLPTFYYFPCDRFHNILNCSTNHK